MCLITKTAFIYCRSNIEKEFAENPLLKNLGITIYGSVHESRLREIAERKVILLLMCD